MLHINCSADKLTWLVDLDGDFLTLDPSTLPTPSELCESLRDILIKRAWTSHKVTVSLSTESLCCLRVNWTQPHLSVALVDGLGSVCSADLPLDFGELLEAFEPLIDAAPEFAALHRFASVIATPLEGAHNAEFVSHSPAKSHLNEWLEVVQPSTFRVAYHQTWCQPRAHNAPVRLTDTHIISASENGLTLVDILSGQESTTHRGQHIPTGFATGLTLDDRHIVRRFENRTTETWVRQVDERYPPIGAKRCRQNWYLWTEDGALTCLSDATGEVLWNNEATTGDPPMVLPDQGLIWVTDSSGVLSQYEERMGHLENRTCLNGSPHAWHRSKRHLIVALQHFPELAFSLVAFASGLSTLWTRRFQSKLVAGPIWLEDRVIVCVQANGRPVIYQVALSDGEIRHNNYVPIPSVASMTCLGDTIAVVAADGTVLSTVIEDPSEWCQVRPSQDGALGPPRITDRGDFWIIDQNTIEIIMPQTGQSLGQIADRPCDGIYPLADGDLIVVFDDSVCRYRLGGHLSVVTT